MHLAGSGQEHSSMHEMFLPEVRPISLWYQQLHNPDAGVFYLPLLNMGQIRAYGLPRHVGVPQQWGE